VSHPPRPDCGCDPGGALDHRCDKASGACRCRPRVNGFRCDTPLPTHYFPTLYQHRYEMEDGRTPEGGQVRYGFDEGLFPGYSWKGFAVFSTIQVHWLFSCSFVLLLLDVV
jgi:laminin alpha 3/5